VIAVALFSFGVAVFIYIVAGYPLLLAALSRRPANPVGKDMNYRPSVSIVVTVYNGHDFLREKIESLLALDYPGELREILVVSDGSTDGSDEIAASFASRGVRLLSLPHGGKPAAINAALGIAKGEILFLTDVRQPIEKSALSHLAANFADPKVGAVTGELRFFPHADGGEQAAMALYWRYELWARGCQSRCYSIFAATGCIYAIRRELVKPIPPDTLADDAVIPLRAYFRGYRIIFDPAAIAYDYPTEEGWEFRRKLRTLAGLWQVYARMPGLLTHSHRMRFHFTSHKFLRLVMPWALLLVYFSAPALPVPALRDAVLATGAALVLGALLNGRARAGSRLKHFTSPARTFLAMNAAALFAVVVFLIPAGTLWGTPHVKVRR
jgi:poly-beta-1,6-N-acetyl-D-glucosamine synthase